MKALVSALAVGLAPFVLTSPALADVTARGLPASVVEEALEDPQPTAFSPADFATEDFSVVRESGSDPSIDARLEAGSLEWVRTAAWVVVPRAVLSVTARGGERGVVTYARASHPLSFGPGEAKPVQQVSALVPVVLIAGAKYPVRVQIGDGASARTATFTLRFTPRPEQRGQVMFDARCSPYGLRVADGAIPADSWLYVGCNAVVTDREEHDSATLELYLLWDQANDVTIDGAPVKAAVDTLYVHRATGGPGWSTLRAGGMRAELTYQMPEPIRPGFLGLGVGPYYFHLKDDRISYTAGAPMLTLYGGYIVNPTMRIVYFNAAVLDRRGYMDQGVYLWTEQVRFIDERLSLNLLLGANALIYSRHDKFSGRFSAPQGFEMVFRDFFARGRNLTAGAFLYPAIAHRSYYNIWLRWGSGAFFGELNFLAWEEPNDHGPSRSESLGISFGTPITRFMRFL